MPELAPVLERMLALWNGEEVDARSVYACDCIENGGDVFDPEAIPLLVEALRSAAPDLRFDLLDWFACHPRYVLRLPAAGTHR